MTHKKILYILVLMAAQFVAKAQPAKVSADKIIAVVGDKIVLKSDIDNSIIDMQRQGVEVPEDARCLSLEQAIGIKALVLQAEKDSLPVSDDEVDADIDNQIRYFITQYGSKDEVERVAGKSLYQLKEDFRQGFRERKLATAMRNKIVDGIKITPNEVKAYFDQIPEDSLPFYESEIEVGQILIFPKASREAEQYSIEQLNDYKQSIESGKKDFAAVANMNTDDPGSRTTGGMYEINRNQKDYDPVWMSKAFTLKEGQISSPFKTRFGYHIIQLVRRAGDDAVVRHILKIPQVTQLDMKAGYQKMDSVRSKLIAATIDFGGAVSKYSEDDGSKFTGGMIQNRNTGSTSLTIDQLDKDLVVKLKDLKVGEYSQPLEYTDPTGRKGIRIIYLKSQSEPHRENLKDDYNKVAQRALEQKKELALEKWFEAKTQGYYVMIAEEYRNCPTLKHWVMIADKSKK